MVKKSDEETTASLGVAERSVYDNLIEDLRRSLRFYAKQTGQSFFKILLTGGAASTPGLAELISSKLNIDSAVLNPFEGVDGADDISVDNPSQFTLAMGLCIRAGGRMKTI